LTADLRHPVQINAYITPASSQGFAPHYDVHDVFVLQVSGLKRWRIHEPVLVDPLRTEPWTDHRAAVVARAQGTPVIDEVLRPGDALYLPRGYLHAAEALGGISCHLTVGVHPLTRQAILDALVALARDDAALRSSLPLGLDLAASGALDADLQATIDALVARLEATAPADVARRVAEGAVPGTRPAPVAPLAQARALAALDGDSVLIGRRHLLHSIRDTDENVVVTMPDRTLRLAVGTGQAVRRVLDGPRLPVRELPGLDADAALALARQLVREGVAVLEVGSGDLR
jgi:bifunctional lysine-specific demethylase and histidyl-hydroxylase NO66